MLIYTIKNAHGMEVQVSNYGATLLSVKVPNEERTEKVELTLGFEKLESYFGKYFGTTVGRYCNRIAGAKITLEGKLYQLSQNEGWNKFKRFCG